MRTRCLLLGIGIPGCVIVWEPLGVKTASRNLGTLALPRRDRFRRDPHHRYPEERHGNYTTAARNAVATRCNERRSTAFAMPPRRTETSRLGERK
jgi:hypothetical protein